MLAVVMMAVIANAQTQKSGVYDFTGKATPSQKYFNGAKLPHLTAKPKVKKFRLTDLQCPAQTAGAMYYGNLYGKPGISLIGSHGWAVGHHVGTSMVMTIGSSLKDAYLEGIPKYNLDDFNGLSGYYSIRKLRCKTVDFSLGNQWELGQLQLNKISISLFGGLFGKVSIEHGVEIYNLVSYEETIRPVCYQGMYDCFILSCGEQLGVKVSFKRWTLSVSENLTSGLWRDYHSPMGPSKVGIINVDPGDTHHPMSLNVALTYTIKYCQ